MSKFNDVVLTKASIRENLLKKRLSLSQKKACFFSEKITEKLLDLPHFKKAKNILIYHPTKNEVKATLELHRRIFAPLNPNTQKIANKTFALIRICPKTNRINLHKICDLNELKTGKFNIKEPPSHHPRISLNKIDLIILPGIAFDKAGNRLGYGKGYFDRLLKKTKAYKIGLAYDFQIVENIPAETHDQKVDLIVTDKKLIKP